MAPRGQQATFFSIAKEKDNAFASFFANKYGYEICDVDEDLIFDLCDRDPDRLEPIGYFKNVKEIENYVSDTITNNEYELDIDSPELKEKIKNEFSGANITIDGCGGLCSFYAEKGGMLIGLEKA